MSSIQPAHDVREDLGRARRRSARARCPGRALHRPAPAARGDVAAGIRGAARARPARPPTGANAGDNGPFHAHASAQWARRAPGHRFAGGGADRAARNELPRIRHRAVRHEQCVARHRARHRAGAWCHAAGQNHCLRRQPHEHARRVRRAGVRNRHQRSRACAGDAVPAAGQAAHASPGNRWDARQRGDREGSDPGDHPPARRRRRDRLSNRISRADDPCALDGGAHDRLQHVDRSRRAGRA